MEALHGRMDGVFEAAERRISGDGFHNLRLTEFAVETTLPEAELRACFPTEADLFAAVVYKRVTFACRLLESRLPANRTPVDILDAHGAVVSELYREHPHALRCLGEALCGPLGDSVRGQITRAMEPYFSLLKTQLRESALGTLSDLRMPIRIAMSLVATVSCTLLGGGSIDDIDGLSAAYVARASAALTYL